MDYRRYFRNMERALMAALAVAAALMAVGAFVTGNTVSLLLALLAGGYVKMWCDSHINKEKVRELWEKKNTTRNTTRR